jgi:hypothetical protein
MHIETQYSIFMVNKPGVLARVLNEFAQVKLNVIALTMMDTVEHGVMRVVASPSKKVAKVLEELNMPHSLTDVLCVTLPNSSGAMAGVTMKLAEAHINISYAYCTAGARGGRTSCILKVSDMKKAMKVLKGTSTTKATKSKAKVRRSPAARR